MRSLLRYLLFIAPAFLATPYAGATPQLSNSTGLWIRPDESGWGLNLIHQGDTMFATLFAYGADNQPRWYSASDLVCDDGGPVHDRPRMCTGALYESSGSPFNVPFDASTVTRRQVGNMSLEIGGFIITLNYNIDDLRVTKSISPFQWRLSDISGTYKVMQYTAPTSSSGEGSQPADFTIAVASSGQPAQFTMTARYPSGSTCTYGGTATPNNMSVYLSGNYTCTDGRNGGLSGFYVDPTPDGFATAGPPFGGRVAAARADPPAYLGNGWMNELWIAPDESGWGLNLLGQGDTLFGTLFTYDSARRPKWYSASALTYAGSNGADGRGRYTGALYESTGPWYGLVSFNQGAVTRRQVGTMTVDFVGDRFANVTYSVDGTTVTKQVQSFAFRMNDMSGSYVGRIVDAAGATEEVGISITDGQGMVLQTTSTTRSCIYQAPPNGRGQAGQRVVAAGSYNCGGGPSGSFTLADAEVSSNGFTGTLIVDGRQGRIAGVRRGP